ncbi:MAG: FHA domain-containing protein [Actinomycetales bacterium]|uniref:FHA domain-containing protein n=1 Tax=Candidatus Phosphoribacter hodrii TaxID=2953743 RepID=A0A935ISS0_9MICO|nr:FHA domain-containing protein [Candidatus Phosphoribacter hodrii]MBK7274356.1 FHA domain-containing protein [Candidatus Phosphoribacter hodrii]MBL0003219.1 FHA domain-containing protein [Candidatus Phosphoribacter hodrii]
MGDWANELSHPAYDASSHVADPDVELLPDRALAPDQPAVAPPPPPPLAAPPPAPAPAPPAKLPRINPAQRPWLDIDGERYPLLGSLTVIGRDATADVILDDPGISRRHSEVRVTHDGPHLVSSIRDLASTNGTFVNGERIASTRLIDGDQITVGRTAITFRAGKR